MAPSDLALILNPPLVPPTNPSRPNTHVSHLRSSTPNSEDASDMSATATLHMQDLDVGDVDNRTNMNFSPLARLPQPTTAHGLPRAVPRSRPSSRQPSQAPPSTLKYHTYPTLAYPLQQEHHQISQNACDDEATTTSKYCYRHRPDARTGLQSDIMSLDDIRKASESEMNTMSQASQDSVQNVWSLFAAAPARERELMLRGLLDQCCFPQLSMVSASVRELLKIDFLCALPPELGLRILCFLDARSLCQAAKVSRSWRALADDDVVWHRMCEQHIDRKCLTCGWGLPLLDRQRLQAEKGILSQRLNDEQQLPLPTTHTRSAISHAEIHQYPDSASDDGEPGPSTQQLAGRKRTAAAAMPEERKITIKKSCTPAHNYEGAESYFRATPHKALRPWKDVYRDRFIIGTNWKHGRCTKQVLKGHTSEVTCLQFDDDIIVTGSYDRTIKIWNIETGEELRTLTGHTMGVKCLQFDKSKLVSGSLDGTLKMWDLKNGKVIRTFPGHSGAVVSVHFDGSILASGSQDRTIRVRDFANCSRVSLRGHTDYVNSVRVDAASQTLFSASDDCTVRIWDLRAKRCMRVLSGHSLQVTQVLPMPCGFEYPDDPMDVDSMGPLPSVDNSGAGIAVHMAYPKNAVEGRCPPRFILSCSMDSTVRLWEVSTGRCVKTFFGHVEGIWALAADTLRMVSGSNDGVVKLWDPRTGRQERTYADHQKPVTCVGLSERRMVTASEDKNVRVYNFGA